MFNTHGLEANIRISDNEYIVTGKDRETLFIMIKLWLEKRGTLLKLLTRSNDEVVRFEVSRDAG